MSAEALECFCCALSIASLTEVGLAFSGAFSFWFRSLSGWSSGAEDVLGLNLGEAVCGSKLVFLVRSGEPGVSRMLDESATV